MECEERIAELDELVKKIKEDGYENICFFQPVYAITGATICKVQMAKYLAKYTDLNVYFCDFEDGHSHQLITENDNIKFLPYYNNTENFPIQEKCIIFATSTRVILLKKMNPENKIIFWHNETVPCAWSLLFINKEENKFFDLIRKTRSMMYHDWSSKDSLNRYQQAKLTNNDFYYVTVNKKESKARQELLENDAINIGFLSRLSSDKIWSLYYLAKNLYDLNVDKKIKLHIIGDGHCKKDVKCKLQEYEDRIELIYTDTIPHEELDDYLINNIDMLFGVGTCTIEAAALALPSAIMLMDNKEIDDNKVFWYSNTKNYCVGITAEQKDDFDVKYNSIEKVVKEILIPGKKESIGKACYEKFLQTHGNFDQLVLNFLNQIIVSNLTFDKLKKCIKYTPYALYKYEIFRILGICTKKRITFANKIYTYILGLRTLKKVYVGDRIKYYVLGLCLAQKKVRKPYTFPNSMRKELAYVKKV